MRRARRWWNEATFLFVESTGLPPGLGGVCVALATVVFLALAAAAAVLPGTRASSQAAALDRSFGPHWRCTNVPTADDICFRETPPNR